MFGLRRSRAWCLLNHMPNQPRPGYRTWYHRVRHRAVNQLVRYHRDEFLTILDDEKRAEPFEGADR